MSKADIGQWGCTAASLTPPVLRTRNAPSSKVARTPFANQTRGRLDLAASGVQAARPRPRRSADGRRYPPHDEIMVFKMLEPFGTAVVILLVNGLVDKALERRDALPDGQVDSDPWIGIGPRAGGVAALVDITPTKPGVRSAKPFTNARLFVKPAIRGSSISYRMRPMFNCAR